MSPASEQHFGATPIAALGGRVLASPFQFVTDDDDNLRIVSANSLAGVTIGLQGRRLDDKGNISPLVHTHVPNSDRSIKTQIIKLGRGALLNLTVFANIGSPRSGQTYVIVQLVKGFSGATVVLGTLLAGYVTSNQALGYPGSVIRSSLEGEPLARTIVGTTPGASTASTETVPTGARWELMAYRIVFTVGVGGAAVPCAVTLDDGTNTIAQCLGGVSAGASTVNPYNFAKYFVARAVASGANQILNDPLPENRLGAASRISFQSTSVLGFPWSLNAPVYNVREWLEVN